MKITVITGSPRQLGSSALLTDRFIAGATEAGHTVTRFDAAFEKVAPCLGCDYCRGNGLVCINNDSMSKLNSALFSAEVLVFITPLYYFGMSAQIKTVIDRLYANNSFMQGKDRKTILIATAADSEEDTMQALVVHFHAIAKYMQWEKIGTLLAVGCGSRQETEKTEFPEQAYQMGRQLA